MVLLFSDRKSKIEKEIIEILSSYGGNYISDKKVLETDGSFTIISCYKNTELSVNKGIAVFCDSSERFKEQRLPDNTVGICEDGNTLALSVFKKNKIPVIVCGMNSKNTITLSSLNSDTLFAALQRTVTDNNGKLIEPEEYKIQLSKSYEPFSVMASISVLLLNSVKPDRF